MDGKLETEVDLFEAAVAAHQQGNLDAAIDGYRDVVRQDPTHKQAFNNLGTALKAQNRIGEAIEAYRQAIALDPHYAAAVYNLGTAHHVAGDLRDAYLNYVKADGLRPNDANTLHNLGLLMEIAKVFDYAADLFRRVLALNPNYLPAIKGLARCLRDLARDEEGLQVIEQAIAMAPQDAGLWCVAGQICMRVRNWARAVPYLRQALQLSPAAVDVRMELALAYFELGQFDKTSALCESVAAEMPNYGGAHMMRARALEGMGDFAAAAKAEAIGRQLPGSTMAWIDEALTQPFAPADRAQIQHIHERFYECLANAERFGSIVPDPVGDLQKTAFNMAYQGHDVLPMMQRLAEVLLRMSPQLAWVAPHCRE